MAEPTKQWSTLQGAWQLESIEWDHSASTVTEYWAKPTKPVQKYSSEAIEPPYISSWDSHRPITQSGCLASKGESKQATDTF